MEKKQESDYGLDYIPLLDRVWGKGFIAPGGEGNVDRIVGGVDLQGKRVLELGSGAGGGTLRVRPTRSSTRVVIPLVDARSARRSVSHITLGMFVLKGPMCTNT